MISVNYENDYLGLNNFEKKVNFGTWVWRSIEIERPEQVLAFLIKAGINEIYLVYDPRRNFSQYRTFVNKSQNVGIRVALIGAQARWVLQDYFSERDKFFSFFEHYQADSQDNERFYGMHMDIEPHQLPEWQNRNEETVQGFCDFVHLSRQFADRTGSLLEMDIPCWFDQFTCWDSNGDSINLTELCIRHADTTLFMSYRDNARAALEFAQTGLKLAELYKKNISLAFETGHIYEEINITFDHLGTLPLKTELKNLRQIVEREYPLSNIGYAVHHYNSWVKLPPNGNPVGSDFPYSNPNYAHILNNKV